MRSKFMFDITTKINHVNGYEKLNKVILRSRITYQTGSLEKIFADQSSGISKTMMSKNSLQLNS